MKTVTKVLLGTAAVATIGAGALTAQAHDLPDPPRRNSQVETGKINRPAWAAEAHSALEANDYEAWRAAHQQAFSERTSHDRFEKLQEFHQLLSDGKEAEARQFAKDNDLRPKGVRTHHRRDHGQTQDLHQALKEAPTTQQQ